MRIRSCSALLYALSLASLLSMNACLPDRASWPLLAKVQGEPEHIYYGRVPAKVWRNESAAGREWAVSPGTAMNRGLLMILGGRDGTSIGVYTLPDGRLVHASTLNRLERQVVPLANGTAFKVVSDKPATVMLVGGVVIERAEWGPYTEPTISTFFTSVEGSYVGKEFVFLAVHGPTPAYAGGLPYRVYALEDSSVVIRDVNGSKVSEFELKANEVKELSFKSMETYLLEASGNAMLEAFTIGKSCFYPAVAGGFVGRLFYGSAAKPEIWEAGGGVSIPVGPDTTFLMTAAEDSKVAIYDMEYRREWRSTMAAKGRPNPIKIGASHMVLESEKPLMLLFKSTDEVGGVSFGGLKAGETAALNVSAGEAYIFTYKDTVVTVDDVTQRLPADSMLTIWEGYHKVYASENIIIEVANIARDQGFRAFGACLPSVQSLGISNKSLRLKPVVSQELSWAYALAAIVLAALAAFWTLKRRGKRG